VSQVRRFAGAAALVLVDGVTPLRPEPALFESMPEGWARQQRSRRLSGSLIESR
jgi:integrase/recombinase XerC